MSNSLIFRSVSRVFTSRKGESSQLKKRLFFHIAICSTLISSNSLAVSPPTSESPFAVSSAKPTGVPAAREGNIQVQTYEVEVGKILVLPAQKSTQHLIAVPEVASVTETKPDALILTAHKIGSTLLIWWDESGVQSAQIVVTRPVREIERIEDIKVQSSKLFQSQRSRTFKFSYESEYSFFDKEKVLSRVTEARKIYNHQTGFHGNTPWGDLKGNFFYEYRKDQVLEKAVALPRDMWLSLNNTDLLTHWLDRYDLSVGRQYLSLGEFGFPGSRYTGFTMLPSLKRIENPEKGRLDISFFIGRERLGAFLDNPAGTNQRNIKLKNRLMGEKVDFYLWKDGKVSLSFFKKWGGPTPSTRSKRNYVLEYDLGVPHFRLKGEMGFDDRSHVGMRYASILSNSWMNLENRFLRINPSYNTLTGTTLDKGRRGYQLRSSIMPFAPLFQYNGIRFTSDLDLLRDLLSVNPKKPRSYYKKWTTAMDWWLPFHLKNFISYEYENRKATSFPFTKRRIRERLSKEFLFNSRWLKRARLYGISTLERYGDAVNTPGFNSTRYELGGGGYVSLIGGIWASSQYLWNRLDESDPNPAPDGRTYPGQLIVSGGISHSFQLIPVNINLSVRYVDERKRVRKLHQPFSDEDRFEARTSLNVRLPYDGIFFVETNTTTLDPLQPGPDRAEFSLTMGVRMTGDTHLYIPQSGTIEGYFYIDQNVNGVKDPEEPGLSGYEVWIEGGPRTKTDPSGYYRLRVREGFVQLRATQQIPEGYFFTTLNQQEIEMLPKKKVKADFGIVPQVQIKGRSYLDINSNQVFDEGDVPMPAVKILLESGQLAVTSADGLYSILRVRPGSNSAQVIIDSIPSGYRTLTPTERKFEGTPGDLLIFDVSMSAERRVSGYVFEDENRNGRFDLSEKGIPGVEVLLGDRKAVTNSDGEYSFSNLNPGRQKVYVYKKGLPREYELSIKEQPIDVSPGFYEKTDANFPAVKEQQASQR